MSRDLIFFIYLSIFVICSYGMLLNHETNKIIEHSNDAGQSSGRKCPNTGCRGGRPGRRRSTSIPSTTLSTLSSGGASVGPPVGGPPPTGSPPAGTTLRAAGSLPPTLMPGSPPPGVASPPGGGAPPQGGASPPGAAPPQGGAPPPGGALPPGAAPPPGGTASPGGSPISRSLPASAASSNRQFTIAEDSEWL